MLNTTQNTRELGGYQTVYGVPTREMTVIRSDVQNYPDEEDCLFLKSNGITTIIDMRGAKDVLKKPSGFCGREGFTYYNFPIDEGSGIPASVDEVPESYMRIASAKSISDVFLCIANADSGVMINCTAGKDRTGVVSAILLLHAGVSDRDITENYVLTKKYGKERLFSILLHSVGAESHIFCNQKALHHANGTGQRNDFYFFSSFSQASAAPSRYSPP